MDQDQDDSHEESPFNLLTLPIELLVYVISLLPSMHDRINLRYISRLLRHVIEETPSLWKEFVWPFYNICQEYSVKEVLKVCGQHIKVLSFPHSKVPSTLAEMLQYCSNVQHLSLPSTKLDPEQLRKIILYMRHLQSLEVEANDDDAVQILLFATWRLIELTVHSKLPPHKWFMHWKDVEFLPKNFNIVCLDCQFDPCYFGITTVPTGTTANFRLYRYSNSKEEPPCFSPTYPHFQMQVKGSNQLTASYVIPSDFGILGLESDLVLMTDCQYDDKTMYMVRYLRHTVELPNSYNFKNLNCVAHFDFTNCYSLHSSHLQQLAIACPHLQELDLVHCHCCLQSLQGLQAIANHCHNLQGLNLRYIHVSEMEDHVLFWRILSDMKLTYLTLQFCVLRSETAKEENLISLYQKCWTIKAIRCGDCNSDCQSPNYGSLVVLSYFPSLNYCSSHFHTLQIDFQGVITKCRELKSVVVYNSRLPLSSAHDYSCHNLQQLCVDSYGLHVPDNFVTSISAHGGLVHVVMCVESLKAEGIISLVRNSPELMMYLCCSKGIKHIDVNVEHFNVTVKKTFRKRKLFTAGYYRVYVDFLHMHSNLISVWRDIEHVPIWTFDQ